MIEHLGKGAIRAPKDSQTPKFRATAAFQALPPIDWSQPFNNPEPPNNDQDGSSSCVAQSWSYYHWQLKNKDFSRRDLYANISLGYGQGAYIKDGHDRIIAFGQATRDEVPDPVPESEASMLDKTGITAEKEASDKELDGLTVSLNIDQWAAAIKLLKGVVGGLEGTDAGWADLTNPRPPQDGDPGVIWGHCLHFFAYHLHDGVKCVIAKSSWGTAGNTTVHHIKQNYFDSGYMFNAYTIFKKGDSMNLINDNGTFYLVGDKGKLGIADPASLAKLQLLTDQTQTGSTAGIPQVGIIEQGFVIHN